MTKPLCIYHGACDDGFAAAWAVRKALGDNVEFYPGVYQKEPPPHAGRSSPLSTRSSAVAAGPGCCLGPASLSFPCC